jgi:phosphoglycolate phosphatase-like HAD superfamily hydrolase
LLREKVERKSRKRRPVSDHIKARDEANRIRNPNNEPNWETWLQDWRVELNAMTTAEFVAWMNAQFETNGAAKVVPSEELALKSVTESVEAKLVSGASIEVREERKEELENLQQQMDELEEEIKEESQARADERFKEIELPTGSEVVEEIKEWLERRGHSHWRNSIDSVAITWLERNSSK